MKNIICVAVMMLMVALLGCERTNTDLNLVVEPANVTLVGGEAVTVTARIPASSEESREIYYPLTWSLQNPELGSLRGAAGDRVVYVANSRSGATALIVRDQTGAEGIVSITQRASAPAAAE